VEKQVKLHAYVEALVKFMEAELPQDPPGARDMAFVKVQELLWWAQKSISDPDLMHQIEEKKKAAEAANASEAS
jgi:hypothetical protein